MQFVLYFRILFEYTRYIESEQGRKMNPEEKSNLVEILAQEVIEGKTLYWSGKFAGRSIDYERAADELTTNWCLFNELVRVGQYKAAGALVAKANTAALKWLISNALDDYGVAPDGYAEDQAA